MTGHRSRLAATGLSTAEARRRLAATGPNTLPAAPPDAEWRRFARQFRSPLIYVLLFALLVEAVVWAAQGGPPPWEALAIAVILVLNAGLGAWQERKAEHAMAEIVQLTAPRAWVIRDGLVQRIATAELVPGDVVRIEAGDRVPADLKLLETAGLMVDESALTGESIPIEVSVEGPVSAGTLIVRGEARAVVERTGPSSAMGRLVGALAAVRPAPTPLERRLDAFGRRVALLVAGVAVAIAGAGLVAVGPGEFGTVFLFAVALAVAAVPEGLPAILTLVLTFGVQRMARRRALVRKLTAVEALGSVTVIATDKTGTLTENRLEVRALDAPDTDLALRAMTLGSSADQASGAGDPLELALLAHATRAGIRVEDLRAVAEEVSSRAFDAIARFTRITVREAGGVFSYVKGAPEVVLDRCLLNGEERRDWETRVQRAAADGYRVIGLARGEGAGETGLQWLGIAQMWDPPRREVPDALRRAREAGIRVVMITGDHAATAQAVARALGLPPGRVVTGEEVAAWQPGRLERDVRDVAIFARVTPGQKLGIVEALQAGGDIVAVTGDGVNDAPALKRADVGIAMGQRGSDVAREVADLVLLDDNFSTIVAAVEEGRGIYRNIESVIRFLFSTNLSELLVVLAGAAAALAFGWRDAAGHLLLPLTAAQLLWVNLVTDGAPALALTLDRNAGVMRRPPRPGTASLLDRSSIRLVLGVGVSKALWALGLMAWMLAAGAAPETMRTAVFAMVALGQLLLAYPLRRTVPAPASNVVLHAAILVGALAQVAVIHAPGLRAPFHTVPLSAAAWTAVITASLAAWATAEMIHRAWRR